MDKITTSGHVQGNGDITTEAIEHQSFPSTSEVLGYTQGARKNYKRVVKRERKHSQVLAGGEYSLKSSHDNARVHSMSNAKNTPCESVNTPVHTAAKRRKTGGPRKGGPKNEYFKIRQRVRYILNRMNYEQSLIEAYASGGWKGQSLEKIRPEKELERAKEEILRCKLRIREAFQNIDSLLSEGKLEESLFDSAGEISSEDIFCAKCGSKDVTLSNDIILCDGLCDRGFHQNCLNPPLLTEDIPAGDEGWLCPACDCKIDCIDILNEQQGSGLSIHDSWEKVFPEAAAVANGPNQNDTSDLLSDDSEDDDYDPNMVEIHVVDEEKRSSEEDEDKESDSDDSDFITSSEGSEHSKNKKTDVELNLASEDLEDDDYDPAGPDSSEDIQKERSSSDESDFTSDSDDFCDEIAKSCGQNEFSVSLLSGVKAVDHTDEMARSNIDTQATAANSNITASESELSQNMVLPGSRRRQLGRLDYKKLYEEAYGKASCDLSDDDDEEWSGRSTPPKDNKESETNSLESLQPAQKSSRAQDVHQNDDYTPQSARERLHPEALHSLVGKQHIEELVSNGGNSTVQRRPFGPVINQRLQEYFKTDPYPSRTTKETLAHELGLTFHQVNKWFENARRSSRAAAAGKGKRPESHSTGKNNSCKAANIEPRETEVGTTEKVVGRNNIASEETMARNLNEGSKQDFKLEPTVVLALPVNNQSCATSSRKVC